MLSSSSQHFAGPILQVDISSRVIDAMNYRCAEYIQEADMQFIQDDATVLSSLNDNKIIAAFDKGLADALFCTDEYDQCYDLMQAIHRVLIPGGVACILSFSRPEFILSPLIIPKLRTYNTNNSQYQIDPTYQRNKIFKMWNNIQIRKLDNIFLYRFVKALPRNQQQQQYGTNIRQPNRNK